MTRRSLALALLISLALQGPALARVTQGEAVRSAPDSLTLTWASTNPVDIFEQRISPAGAPRLERVAVGASEGRYVVRAPDRARRYFVLVDTRDKSRLEVAERVLPLEQGSNFRDIGGYVGAGGKRVKWGMIFRSGGQPTLNAGDQAQIQALRLKAMIDLRSSEERVLAPTKIMGVPYAAVGYSMNDLMRSSGGTPQNGLDVYRGMPRLLAPHLRIVFQDLLRGDAPLVYNCSAGQDRTGFTTALILTVLGVSREDILKDYHLSTAVRRPEWEMPAIDTAAHPGDTTAAMFAQGRMAKPTPLKTADGRPFLDGAFAEIREKWGSVDNYLLKEAGVTAADQARLRRMYLE